MRDHKPTVIDKFMGLYVRGNEEECPIDHFTECNNIKFVGNGIATRDGIAISQDVAVPLENIKRVYNFPTQTANTLIVLTVDGANGKIYHVVSPSLVYGPILTIAGMTDFAFQPYAGRGYISPFSTFVTGELNIEKGLQNQFLYVYLGAGVAARKAAGVAPTGTMIVADGAAGNMDQASPGARALGVVWETDSGYLTPVGSAMYINSSAGVTKSVSNLPQGDATVTRIHLVASKITHFPYPAASQLTYYFIPGASVANGVTFINNVGWFEADLLAEASGLDDNYAEIPAGAVLSFYHNRLCLATTYNDISLILVSAPGEPEAFNQIDGLIVVPLDGNPITGVQELRDVLYAFKRTRTVSYVDTGEEPSTWPLTVTDNALGTCVHGIATVLDSGSASVDFLIVCNYSGVILFNGLYSLPELSWKIETLWRNLDRNEFGKIQIIQTPINKEIYIVLPDKRLLVANYALGMDPKNIRWTIYTFHQGINTLTIWNIDQIIIGSDIPV